MQLLLCLRSSSLVVLVAVTAAAGWLPSSTPAVKASNRRNEKLRGDGLLFEPLASGKWTRDPQFVGQLHEPLCRPRPALVPVTAPRAAQGAKFFPEHVVVPRCEGSCGASSKACVATATSTARVPVLLLAPPANTTAGHVLVARHDACSCGCATQPHHCTHHQEYVAGECACRCRPSFLAEKERCSARERFVWDEELCRCGCRLDTVAGQASCRHGSVWVALHCKCLPYLSSGFINGTENIFHKFNKGS